MRVAHGGIPWLTAHRARLRASCEALLPDLFPMLEEAFEACRQLAGELGAPQARMRLTAWMGHEQPHVAARLEAATPERGPWRIGVGAGHPGPGAGAHKQTARVPWDRALAEARRRGLDELLMLDEAGRVVEGSRTSLFAVMDDGTVWTPPLTLGALPGVARARACDLLVRGGMEVRERVVSLETLMAAREVICTNAWLGAVPVASLETGEVFEIHLGSWLATHLFD